MAVWPSDCLKKAIVLDSKSSVHCLLKYLIQAIVISLMCARVVHLCVESNMHYFALVFS